MKTFFPLIGVFFFLTQQNIALAHDGQGRGGRHGKKLIEELDTNKDSQLSREEVKSKGFLGEKFDEIDTNKDGNLSSDELKAHRKANRPPRTPAQAAPDASSGTAE